MYVKIEMFAKKHLLPGANSTIAIYNATGSLARFENKNILFSFEKHSSLCITMLAL
jgi:hypothetical protein